jgi:hypothetical protein
MTALLLLVLAGAALSASIVLLRRLGPRYRVARLLAAAPMATLADAHEIADGARPQYVRIHGRISSDEEFPDDHDRPLVYRRRRVEVKETGGWRSLADDREAVPFGVEERGVFVGVDAAAIDVGLVVVSREAAGVVGDLPGEYQAGLDPAAPSRLVIEQVSAVEHAYVAGVPVRRGEEVVMAAGLGRPLVLTTLDIGAAMRVLARDHRRPVLAVTILLGLAVLSLALALVAWLAGMP